LPFNVVAAQLRVALSFSRLALRSRNPQRVQQNAVRARDAYEAFLYTLEAAHLKKSESDQLQNNFEELRANLALLGF
jgi:hypothetical protein